MTCPISHDTVPAPRTERQDATITKAVEEFERVGGSVFLGLFATALFDQAMLPEVSAALEQTGRIRNNPWERAIRTTASDQLVYSADADAASREFERLKTLHRDVKGVSADGVRYSAFNPQTWNFILYSTFFAQHGAFVALSGRVPTTAENQAIWDFFRGKVSPLELPGQSRLIESYEDLVAHYREVAATKLQVTPTLESAVESLRKGPRPYFLPPITAPLWRVSVPVLSHTLLVLGRGIMHPAARANMPGRWTSRHEAEFAVLTTALRFAFAVLPTYVTDTPLARNRRQYRKLVAQYEGLGLSSFAPGA